MHYLKPKKYLGQHFLKDTSICERIIRLLSASSLDTVVEIGPGEGVLTQFLYVQYKNLLLVEIDPEAVQFLSHRFHQPPINIIHRDILAWKLASDIPEDTYFIGNLPYNISSPIFFRLLDHVPFMKEGVFMLQLEVAERICAHPGSKKFGILSVLLGAYFRRELCFQVPPEVFRPPPKVMSAVIRLERKEILPEVDFVKLKRLVKTAFHQRRKTLKNALKSVAIRPFDGLEEILKKRAEALPVEMYIKLTHYMEK